MALALYPPRRPQSIGEVLDSGFRIFRATLLRCLAFGVLAMVAGQLQNIYDLVASRPMRQLGAGDPLWWIAYLLGTFLAIVFLNAVLLRQRAMAAGLQSETGAELREALRRGLPATAVIILSTLAVAAFFLPLVVIPGPYLIAAGLLLAIPATYVGMVLSYSWFAVVIGGKGIVASLRYSAHLIRGSWWRTATVYSVAFTLLAVFFVLAIVIAVIFVPFSGTDDIARITSVSQVLIAVLGVIAAPFYCAIALALYGDLEARKQGTDLERQIAGAPTD